MMTLTPLNAKFPRISASNLKGKRFDLPQDLEGNLNIVIIAFKREQQRFVDDWKPFLSELTKKVKKLSWYELPIIQTSYLIFRWIIDGGMRSGIPKEEARKKIITIYTNKKKFRQHLNILNEDLIHILLIDKKGRIIWRADGRYTKKKMTELELVLKKHKLSSVIKTFD